MQVENIHLWTYASIKSFGFEQNLDEPCVYKRHRDKIVMFLVLYVDDILLIGNDVGVM